MSNITLYVETDGTSDSPEKAIAEAAVHTPDSIPFDEGELVEVKIEATWTTPDGNHHARVSVMKKPDPTFDDRRQEAGANPMKQEPDDFLDNEDVEMAHDHLTDPENSDDDVLELTPAMEHAEDEFEDNFHHASHRNAQGGPDEEISFEKEGYNSEGLRRDKEPQNTQEQKPKPKQAA
jgi:hypothetical protein